MKKIKQGQSLGFLELTGSRIVDLGSKFDGSFGSRWLPSFRPPTYGTCHGCCDRRKRFSPSTPSTFRIRIHSWSTPIYLFFRRGERPLAGAHSKRRTPSDPSSCATHVWYPWDGSRKSCECSPEQPEQQGRIKEVRRKVFVR